MDVEGWVRRIRACRVRLAEVGPPRTRPMEGDFAAVSVGAGDCDVLREVLVGERARVVVEIGLAYASSALAIGEAIVSTAGGEARHVAVDPFQTSSYRRVGWEVLCEAGLAEVSTLYVEWSSLVLPRLLGEGLVADAAFVDGSHRFHEVFVDLYFLRKLVRPGGLIVLDDVCWPSVAAAVSYFDVNLGWREVPMGRRLVGRRLPMELVEPDFREFRPFLSGARVGRDGTG